MLSDSASRLVVYNALRPHRYTVHGILQARILEWVVVPFSKISSQPRDWTQVSLIAGGFFTSWANREAWEYWSGWPIPSPADLSYPRIELGSPALQVDSLPAELQGKPLHEWHVMQPLKQLYSTYAYTYVCMYLHIYMFIFKINIKNKFIEEHLLIVNLPFLVYSSLTVDKLTYPCNHQQNTDHRRVTHP